MNDDRSNVERHGQLDMQRSSVDQSQMEIVETQNNGPPIFKMKMDHFEVIFENLPISELRALRETCKRMKQYTDYFIKTNYPALKLGYGKIYLRNEDDIIGFRQLDPIQIKMIKEAQICPSIIKEDICNVICPQLERLTIIMNQHSVNLRETILKSCSILKQLSICQLGQTGVVENEWMQHSYPEIEHFHLSGFHVSNIMTGLKKFFGLNSNIKTFSTGINILTDNRNFLVASRIKIDRLHVDGRLENIDVVLLDELFDRGFYKRLQIDAWEIDVQGDVNRVESLRGMEKLYLSFSGAMPQISLAKSVDLRELVINCELNDISLETLAKSLVKVERVYITSANFDQVLSFVRHARTVKEIKVDDIEDSVDLLELDKARKLLTSTNKVTLYVDEAVFLRTKKILMKTVLSLVTLKRAQAVEWKLPSQI